MNEREFGVSDVLGTGWYVYCKQFKAIAIMMLIGSLPGAISNYIIAGDATKLNLLTGLLIVVGVVLMAIMYMGVILIVENTVKNDNVEMDWSAASNKAYSRLGSCIVTSLLAGLILMGLSLLLVIPGIIWSLYYAFLLQVVILRGIGGKAALDYSKSLVKGRWWKVFGILFVLGLIVVILSLVLGYLSLLLPQVLGIVISLGTNIFALGFQIVGITILFLNLDYLSNRQSDSINTIKEKEENAVEA